MSTRHIKQFVAELWDDSVVPTLMEYIRIPNKSPAFEPDWQALGHMDAAAAHLQRWAAACGVRGLAQRIVALPGRPPVLLCEVEGSAPGNAMLYGHYDKQPEFEGWTDGLGPWTPALRNGRLYGRGSADDGYAVFAALAAIAALQHRNLPHPRCVALVEGCEESGSYDLPAYLDALAGAIGTPDLVICLDAECGNYEQLWLTTSLRGMLSGTLTVRVLVEGVHSGAAGGIVPSSFRLLRQLIERIENARTGELHSMLQVPIADDVRRQAAEVAATLGALGTSRFPWAGNTGPGAVAAKDLVLANTWQPSLAAVGLDGAPAVANAGNTLRPATAAKLVFRLPPTLDADAAAARVKALFERDPPHGADVVFELEHPQTGWHAPARQPWLTAALAEASDAYFGAPLATMGCGGTIPFMKMLGDRYPEVQFAATGVLGPNSNAHGPNEFLDIATGKRVTACVAHLLQAFATRQAGGQPQEPQE